MIFIYISLGIFLLGFIWHFSTLNWRDIYTLTMVFGRKGRGKSTMLCQDAYRGFRNGWKVYTQEKLSFQIRDKKTRKKITYVTETFDPAIISTYEFPPRSLILVDEASLIKGWSNRDFRDTPKATIEWFQQMRKHQCRCILYSVSFDLDKKIRDCCDNMILVNKYFRVFAVGRVLHREPVIVHPVGDSPASIQDDIIEEPPVKWIFGGIRILFIPKWSKYFDSFRMVVQNGQSLRSDQEKNIFTA